MNRLKLSIFLLFTLLFAQAEIKLPVIFSDNMLLQQNAQMNIWGKADANKTVTIKASWSKNVVKTTADAAGNWKTSIATPKVDGKKHTLTLSDGKSLTLNNSTHKLPYFYY